MNNTRKQFIYVSGPPCAGKSAVSSELVKRATSFQHIMGDDYWILNEQYEFKERIEKTNQDIISSVNTITSNSILLEWVPSFGPFVECMRGICECNDYEFIHIVITAPKEVLERRKLNRDGNMELGPVDTDKYTTLKKVILFDSSVKSVHSIVTECAKILDYANSI